MKQRMKKILVFLLSTMMIFALTACGNKTGNSNEGNTQKEAAKDFPSKPIQIVVPFSAGGGTDSVARSLADAAKKHFSQPVVIVNKTGGGGAVGMAEGSNAKADGHTVTMITVELATLPNLGLAPFTYEKFKPVVQVNADPSALTVRADAPYNTVEEFIEYAKNHPGEVKVGNSGVGAIWHLSAAGIENKTGIKLNHVPFDGAAPATVALLGGHVDAVTVSPAEVLSHVKSKKLKVLGVLADDRIESMKDVPTFKEQGYDLSIGTWRGLAVPKDTPDEVVAILEEGFTKAANEKAFKDVLEKLGLGYKVVGSKDFDQTIKENHTLFKTLIEELGLKK